MPIQYSVPQFIDVENKIIGPISVRQFIIIAANIGLEFVFYKTMDFPLFLLSTVIAVTITVLFAFVKMNGRPFHYFMLNFMQSVKNPHLRVWKKEVISVSQIRQAKVKVKAAAKKATSAASGMDVEEERQLNYTKLARKQEKMRSRLSDLSVLVDTGGYFEKPESPAAKSV